MLLLQAAANALILMLIMHIVQHVHGQPDEAMQQALDECAGALTKYKRLGKAVSRLRVMRCVVSGKPGSTP